tara:strand:- start:277 stop:1158 length:882 start_codon:yes stop_codon:yes gene_type:complete
MKGIILAGGSGTRLYPLTKGVSKQLLSIGSKPMIYYPLSVLMQSGIRDILLISTPEDINSYEKLLGDGSMYGINIQYKIQSSPDGLAQAFILGENFIGKDPVTLILGDNVFISEKKINCFKKVIKKVPIEDKSYIFGYKVKNPNRFGVAEFDKNSNLIGIEEKPKFAKSNYAIIGVYCYTNDVVEKVKMLTPSKRGELEITSLNEIYLKEKRLKIDLISNEFQWIDTGTIEALEYCNKLILELENKQNTKLAVLEKVALENKFITKAELKNSLRSYPKNNYTLFLEQIFKDEV